MFPGRALPLLRHTWLICLTVIVLTTGYLAAAPDPPALLVPEGALLALAQKKFGTLSLAEELFFLSAQSGTAASVAVGDEEEDDPANAANWPAGRTIRAACIAWVCSNPQAAALVAYRGLQFYGMCIDGELNLVNADIKFQFLAWKCAFSEKISLRDAQIRGLSLLDCRINGLNANRAIIKGGVLLRSVRAESEINLGGAKIDGNLDCSGAQFLNAEGLALTAYGAKIERSVILAQGFKADGEVNLMGATIGGNLDCEGGQFSNAVGPALNADSVKVSGSVFLRKSVETGSEVPPFNAEGEVNLAGATIDGDLDCEGGQFSNAKRPAPEGQFSSGEYPALGANAATIKGSVYLRRKFRSEGEVNLVRTTIGDLQIRGLTKTCRFLLDLRLAKVETMWDEEASWPGYGKLFLDGFRYERLYQGAPLQADSRTRWLNLQKRDKSFRSQPYEHLATVLAQMGHDQEARQIMIEKNRERARFTQFPHGDWWWYNLFGRFIGYGYEPWRALGASLVMIVFGAYLFRDGFTHGLIEPTEKNAYAKKPDGQVTEEKGRPKISEKYPVFNAFVYSFESFAPLLKLDQSGNWTPNANGGAKISLLPFWSPRTGSLVRGYLYFHIASGWLLTSLWVGAVTGLVKT